MEPLDEFDSLLKGAAARYNPALPQEDVISKMIDQRLTETKRNATAAFRREIIRLVLCAIILPAFQYFNQLLHLNAKPKGSLILNVAHISVLVYLAICMLLFIQLIRISRSQKDTDVGTFITVLYKKTTRALSIYLWLSDVLTVFAIGAILFILHINWYVTVLVPLVYGVIIHFFNIWYIRKRFGQRVDEMKALMNEFS